MHPDITRKASRKPLRLHAKVALLTLSALDRRTRAAKRVKQHLDRLRKQCGGTFTAEQQAAAERLAIANALVEDRQTRALAGERIGLFGLTWAEAQRRRAERDLQRLIKVRPRRTRLPSWMARLPELEISDNEEAEQTK
jgi:hypothetical protein